MTGLLIYEREGAERNAEYIKLHKKHGEELGIRFSVVICDEEELPQTADFAIVRAMRPDITKILKSRGIPTFNNYHVSKICNDKALTYEYLSENGIPVIPWLSANRGDEPPEIPSFPMVIKPRGGHGGKNVSIIRNDDEYKKARDEISPDGYVVQHLASDSSRDMRVYVLGSKIVGAVLRTASGDFRSNFSLGGKVSAAKLTPEEYELVERVCSLFDFDLVGIDIMYHNDKPVINEIEDVVGSRMLYATHDIDIVKMYLEYILTKLSSTSQS